MHRTARAQVAVFVVGLCLMGVLPCVSSAGTDVTNQSAPPRPFIVFDATLYKNKPSFVGYPIRPITLIYEARLFPGSHAAAAMPPEQTVRSIAKELKKTSEPVILDIERWMLKGDAQTVHTSVNKFLAVVSWMKDEAPNLQIGAYGTVPLPDYWRAIRGQTHKEYRAWQQDNDRLDEMAAQLDALYPSLYTFYPDRQGWVTYAVGQIREARRKANGKPVYAFLWPQYHDGGRGIQAQLPIESDFWELQLNTMLREADGIVIWGGWGAHGPDPWNEDAPWWQVTKRFLKQIGSPAPNPPTHLLVR